ELVELVNNDRIVRKTGSLSERNRQNAHRQTATAWNGHWGELRSQEYIRSGRNTKITRRWRRLRRDNRLQYASGFAIKSYLMEEITMKPARFA
ncbi:MAG: hypothetical protein ACT6WE_25565, partial [Shinella sp.]|uniref:hypothetical protein n=1 Tax=Shinella sp. TaxID=1870904 RepID=UPI0040358A6A